MTVTATLSTTHSQEIVIPLVLTKGSAEETDYGALARITINANSLTGTGDILTREDTDTDNETFTVALGALPNTVTAGTPRSVLIRIADNDPPEVTLSASPNPVTEGSPVTVTATLARPLSSNVDIPLVLTKGSAEETDYGALARITINANSTTGTGQITTVQDTDTDNETFTVALGVLPSTVTAGTPRSIRIRILDRPTVTLSASPNPVAEGSPVTVTATLSRALASRVVIPVTLTRHSAETGDYGSLARITVNANSTTGTGQITTVQDADTDPEEFTVSLGTLPSTVTAGTPSSVRIRITETVPSAPDNLTTRATGDGSGIVVAWRAPASTGSSAVARYIVYAGRTSTPSDSVGTSTLTTFTLTPVAPATAYYFRVRAVNGDGHRSPFSAVASFTTAAGGADATKVRGLTAFGARRQITLAWQAPTGARGLRHYRVQTATASGGPFTDLARANATAYTHAGLPDGVTRWYRVAAVYGGNNQGTWSDVASATTNGPPGAPRDLTATKGATRVTLRWRLPEATGGLPITGYRIERAEDGESAWTTVASVEGNVTQYAHEDAVPPRGRRVEYRVIAINALGESPPSNVATVTTAAERPSAPRDVSASASGTTVTVAWTAPADDGGAPVTGYRVEVSAGNCRSWREVASTVSATTLSYTDTDLEPATSYCYRVLARNRVGLSPPSNVARAGTEAVLPGAPRDLAAVAQGRSEILLEWQPPAEDGGSPVTGYRIDRSTDKGASWLTIHANTGTTSTSYMDRELEPGTLYRYRVSAMTQVGQGPPSGFAEARTHGPPGRPRDLVANAVSPEQINLWWTPPDTDGGPPVTGYVLEFSSDGGGAWEVLSRLANERTYGHAGLRSGTVYHYRVSAVNAIGVGLPSQTAEARTHADVPSPPRDLSARVAGPDRIDLRWRAPAHDGGSAVTGYLVEASTDGGASWFTAAESHGGLEFAHAGLAPATTYRYRVSAINAVGTGEPGAFAEARTHADTPARPPDLVAEAVSHDRIDLRWLRPERDGGSPVVGYRIDVTDDGGDSWLPLLENTGTTKTSYAHTGLEHATVYGYRVAAINEVGRGPWSPQAEARTHAVVPGSPRDLTAAVAAHDQIDLAWMPPADDGGAPVTAMIVEVSRDRRDWKVLAEVDAPARAYSHIGPEPGVTWSYRVSAVNEAGRGPASDVASATIDDAVRRTDRVNEAILPYFAANAAGSAVRAISDRVAAVAAGDAPDARVNLTGARNGLEGLADGAAVSRPVGGGLSAWAAADLTDLGTEGTVEWDGQAMSMHGGIDGMLRSDLLVGLAGNRSGGAFEFTDRTNDRDMAGDYEAALTTITPYVAWVREDMSAWAAAGAGWGSIMIADSAAERTSRIASSMMAVGGTRTLGASRVGSFGLRAEGWTADVRVGGNVPDHLGRGADPKHVNEAEFTTRRARIVLDWTITNQAYGSNRFEAVLRGGARRDWHSTDTGVGGAEVGGELRMISPLVRARGEGRMFVHSSYREWGVRGMFELRSPGGDGLSVQATPSYGAAESGVETLWDTGVQGAGVVPTGPVARLGVTAAYKPPGTPLALVGRYDSAQRALTFGTKLQHAIEWLLESRYTGRQGLGLSVKGSQKF